MNVVTGSFGYIGKYITKRLLDTGQSAITITTHPDKPNPFGDKVKAFNYDFDKPDLLTERLTGCDCLFNTYWVRFDHKDWSFAKAIENTRTLFDCARKAGIKKIVHISVTNPKKDDHLPYYKGKAIQEKTLRESGVPWSIIRPTVVFGKEDILINNIAWTIRHFPAVPIFGKGDYRLQPVFVEDLAAIAVECARTHDSEIIDAVGSEILTYEELLKLLATKMDKRPLMLKVQPDLGIFMGKIIGHFVKDVVLTKDELTGLMEERLTSEDEPNAPTLFSEWLEANKDIVGTKYTSELARHFY